MADVPAGDVVITGAAGRIGTSLRASLTAAGYTLRLIDIVRPEGDDVGRSSASIWPIRMR